MAHLVLRVWDLELRIQVRLDESPCRARSGEVVTICPSK